MDRVTVAQYRGPRRIVLDAGQARLFTRELRRIRRYMPAGKHRPTIGVGADCRITIKRPAGKSEYLLFGRSVLVHPKTGKTWQFWFGLQLLEWLYA